MSTSQRTFHQVKSILGKLDQRIDSLRAQRTVERVLGGVPQTMNVQPIPATSPAAQPSAPVSQSAPAYIPGSNIGAVPTQPAAPRSPYGRATPIRQNGQ